MSDGRLAAPDRHPSGQEAYEQGVRTGWYEAGLFVRDDPAAVRAYAAQAGFTTLTDAEAEFVGRIVGRIRMGLQHASFDGAIADLAGEARD